MIVEKKPLDFLNVQVGNFFLTSLYILWRLHFIVAPFWNVNLGSKMASSLFDRIKLWVMLERRRFNFLHYFFYVLILSQVCQAKLRWHQSFPSTSIKSKKSGLLFCLHLFLICHPSYKIPIFRLVSLYFVSFLISFAVSFLNYCLILLFFAIK